MTRKFLTPIQLPADPTLPLEAATKQYVDGKAGGGSEVEITATDPIGTNAAAELWYDTDATSGPITGWNQAWGVVAYAPATAEVICSTTQQDVPGCSITFTAVEGRRYRMSFETIFNGATTVVGYITDGANTQKVQRNATTSGQAALHVSTVETGLVGSVTRKARINVTAGSGTMQTHSTLYPTYFMVEDVGPASGFVAQSAPTPITQWNAAWGVVAKATMKGPGIALPNNTAVSMAVAPLVFTLLAGRRYAVRGRVRAVTGGVNVPTSGYAMLFVDGVQQGDTYLTNPPSNSYSPALIDWHVEGDGVSRSYDFRVQVNGASTGTAYPDGAASYFLIEDIGPTAFVAPDPPVLTAVPWTNVTIFTNGWANAPGWQPAQYRKVGDEVQVRGNIYNGTANQSAFTLPAGYRPAYPTGQATGVTAGNAQYYTDGTVTPNVAGHIVIDKTFSVTP